MGKLFGTDGVRGIANVELTNELAYKLGRVGAFVLTRENHHNKSRLMIGKDPRVSGDMLESSLIAGILSAGCDVIKVGVVPTPAIAYLVRHLKLDAGVMISASHNPAEYNGIKFFNSEGFKLSDEIEAEIERYILNDLDIEIEPSGLKIGRKTEVYKANDLYAEFVASTIDTDLEGLRIAIDCANGSSSEVAVTTLRSLGAKVDAFHHIPDGININDNCGSTHTEIIAEIVREGGYDAGLAFDGDADRCLAVDEHGSLVDGDKIMTICAIELQKANMLKDNTVVSTVMSNIGLEEALQKSGMKALRTKVGDRYVLEAMREHDYVLGGEQSGHIIFLNHNTTGDGLLTAVKLLSAMKKSGKSMSELASVMQVYPQVLKNARIKNEFKQTYMSDEVISGRIAEVEAAFSGRGRVLIRPSGTEPLVRVMIEGDDQSQLEAYANELVALIESRLGHQ
jgi:phosphoglucosamine mutase